MTDAVDRVAAFVEALLKGQRPPRFPAEREDADALRVAAALHAAIPGADAPQPEFVARLARQLAAAAERPAAASLTRRRLLARLGIPASAALVGAAAATAFRTAADWLGAVHHAADESELVPQAAGHWVPVVPLASLAAGRPVRFTAGAIQGFLVQQGDRIQAVSAVCTHLGCLLAPNEQADRLDCPCHGASFTLAGAPLNPEYTTPLPRLQVRISGEMVEVLTV
jgi:nitrite reductase/ring-hydroxylating ferredoxin subunit